MQTTRYGRSSSPLISINRLLEGPAAWLISLVVLPALLVVALLLPPINLLSRLQAFTYTRIGTVGGAVHDPDGTVINFPSEGVRSSFMASVASTPRQDFFQGVAGNDLLEAARNLPEFLIPKSPYYDVELVGSTPTQAILSIPIPNDSLPYETLGLYGWNGERWEHIPSMVLASQDIIEARLPYVPASFMVMQTTPPVPSVTADLGLIGQLPPDVLVTSEAKAGLYLRGDGALEGVAPVNSSNTLPIIRNWDESVVRTDLINNLLIDPGLQENQVVAIEQTVVQNGYPGVVIDYRGVDAVPSARADFVHLISKLAERLHASNKTLAVRVESPHQVSTEEWDTLGYDWAGLGAVVDRLIIPAPVDPRAYVANSETDALLTFAASEVERRKVEIEFPAQSVERSGNYLLLLGYQEALRPLLAEVSTGAEGGGIAVSLDNPRLLSQVTWDDAVGMYYYKYVDDQGFERTVFIETAGSVGHKLKLLQKYNVRNVSIASETAQDVDPALWNVLLQFQQGSDLSGILNQLSVAYTVYGGDGSVVAQEVRPIDNPGAVIGVSGDNLRVDVQVINSSGQPLGSAQPIALNPSVTAAPVQAAAAAVTDVAAEAPQVEGEAAARAASVDVSADPNAVTVSSGQVINVREGPGTNYPVLGQVAPGTPYAVLGKNEPGDWWQIDYNGGKAWVVGQLVSTSGDTGIVALATDIPEAPAASVAAASAPASAPVVSAPAPTGGGDFGYGVQAHMVHNDQAGQVMSMTRGMGFGWVKQQVEWRVFEGSEGARDFGSLDGIVNAANGAGVNLLFSVVNAPTWARESGHDGGVGGPPQNPQTYANFVGALAGKYCGSALKAIEVWNEQNLHYEWGNKPLNPGEYVALLAPAYAAIKGACPSMYVLSGALTPAGNNPPYAMDDFTYMEEMFKAGMNNYMDGVGAHPSGYNVPPSVTWEGGCEAIQRTGNSFNGACDSPHHSWSFRSTMEGYRNIMNVYGASNKKIWPTEFGWAAGGAYHPSYKYADDNDFTEQAQWTVEAYQMMRSWGWVGPAFLWNLNFRVVANGTEKAQWGIVGPSWEPLPVYNALAGMPK